jgi:precorrin-6B C5,15-methyltransferase / cobalt-precorrin-6B C5,C15-methyltransferase
MSAPVQIIGLGADGPGSLSTRSHAAIAAATFLAGGRRHLELVGPTPAETFAITNNLAALADRLRRRGPDERCVVLASGDPLCFGIGHVLGEALGRDQIIVEPAVSSLQLAFARAGLSWHDAATASVHGRPLAQTLLPLLGRPKIGLLTQDGTSPAAIAAFFLERGLDDYDAWVGEDLGAVGERVTALPLAEVAGRRFGDLNVVVLERRGAGSSPTISDRIPGIPDARFAQPASGPVLLTHADVRAVTLARFRDLPAAGPIWDIGAGLGGVAVELARAFPGREVVAVERSQNQRPFLEQNRLRFACDNLRIVAGEAPACLANEEDPAAVFLGGSGGRLDGILDLIGNRLLPGGVLVANFVGLENLTRALERLRRDGWPTSLTQVQVSHGEPLAGLTALAPLRPVWITRAAKEAR